MNFCIVETGEPGRYHITSDGNDSFLDFFQSLVKDRSICLIWNKVLASIPLNAFYWELPPLDQERLEQAFECMLMDAPLLERPANPAAFLDHFSDRSDCTTRFWNLGRDARLVVPVPDPGNIQDYSHLAAFCRNSDDGSAAAFWKLSGETVLQEICELPRWVSTSGAGVAWLHLRIDSYPKYYVYAPYRSTG